MKGVTTMGRELKRVPLDFQWPMNAVWKGYINPYRSVKCGACYGTGYSEKAMEYKNRWYGLHNCSFVPNPYRIGCTYNPNAHQHNLTQLEIDALLKEGRLKKEWLRDGVATPGTVKEWNLTAPMGFDTISKHICMCATAEYEGWDTHCPYCNGTGEHWVSDKIKTLAEEWRNQDPPTGDGYQLWTTTNEGAPISPVFPTMEELAEWCEDGATIFGFSKISRDEWIEFFRKECFGYEIAPGIIAL